MTTDEILLGPDALDAPKIEQNLVYAPRATHHRFFLCATCKRPISGCLPSCLAPQHVVELVDNCAVCASGAAL